MAPGSTDNDRKPRNGRLAVGAWKVAIPILVAAALALGGWTLRATTSQEVRIAVVETKAMASEKVADTFRTDVKDALTEIKTEISGLRDDINQRRTP